MGTNQKAQHDTLLLHLLISKPRLKLLKFLVGIKAAFFFSQGCQKDFLPLGVTDLFTKSSVKPFLLGGIHLLLMLSYGIFQILYIFVYSIVYDYCYSLLPNQATNCIMGVSFLCRHVTLYSLPQSTYLAEKGCRLESTDFLPIVLILDV